MHLEFPKQHTDQRRRYSLCCGTDQECIDVIRDGKMQDIILVGSGGCMREIVWQMQEQNKSAENWNILGYVDRMPPEEHSSVTVGNETIEYIGNDDYLLARTELTNVAVCVGEPKLRKKIVEKLKNNNIEKTEFLKIVYFDEAAA